MPRRKIAVAALLAGALIVVASASRAQNKVAVTYGVDAAHSNVGFSVSILDGVSKVAGKFTDFNVTINFDEADIAKSAVNATIKAASIDTGIERRDAHLRNADFFDVEKYPEITFQSKRVEKKGNGYVAHGAFTMHGVTKEIALPFTITGAYQNPMTNATERGFNAKLTLNRQDYGVAFRNPSMPNFVGDMVEIELSLITKIPPKQS